MRSRPNRAEPLADVLSPRMAVIVALGIMFAMAGFFTVIVFTANQSDRSQYGALAEFGVGTTATVTRSEPQNHGATDYTFEVAGKTYASGGLSPPGASDPRVGDTIQIVYDPRDPNDSCACDPDDKVRPPNLVTSFLAGLTAGGILAAFVVRRPLRPPSRASAFLPTTVR